MRIANEVLNNTPNMRDARRRTPEQMYTNTEVQAKSTDFAHFGCPAYVLHDKLQQGQKFHKWKDRARVGVYIGRSPHHARSVGLILDLHTGHVSPQYHFRLDKKFETSPYSF